MSDDLISREAAIDKIMNLPRAGSRPFVSYEAVIKTIFDSSLIHPEQKWIPCSKMLPRKEKKTYWICTDTEYQCECRWTNDRFGLGEGEWGDGLYLILRNIQSLSHGCHCQSHIKKREQKMINMNDLISRQIAIDAIKKDIMGGLNYESILKELPAAQSTIFGYNVEHLELIARVLQKENLPPEEVAEILTDIGRIVTIIRDEFEEILQKAVENR